MSTLTVKQFREVFDTQLQSDGFVWRDGMYQHVDFENFWYIFLWVKSKGQGHYFDVLFYIGLLSNLDTEHLREYADSFGTSFLKIHHMKNPYYWSRDMDYTQALKIYLTFRNRFHQINTLYEAYQALMELSFTKEIAWLGGENLIDLLLYLNKKEEAITLLKAYNKQLNQYILEGEQYNQKVNESIQKLTNSLNHELSDTVKEKKESLILLCEKDINTTQKRIYHEKEGINHNKLLIDSIIQGTIDDRATIFYEKSLAVADMLKKHYTKQQLEIMKNNWRDQSE